MADYSINFVGSDAGPCAACGGETGRGAVGWSQMQDQALCDSCILERSPHLGMVLNMALVVREIGGIEPEDVDQTEAVYQLLTLARIYEDAAAKVWPARKPGLLEFAKRWGGEQSE